MHVFSILRLDFFVFFSIELQYNVSISFLRLVSNNHAIICEGRVTELLAVKSPVPRVPGSSPGQNL